MLMKPFISLLLFARNMPRAQVWRAADHDHSAGFVAGGLRQQTPEVRSVVILSHASPCPETCSQFRGGAHVAGIGGFQEQSYSLAIILFHSISACVTQTERILCRGITAGCEPFKIF